MISVVCGESMPINMEFEPKPHVYQPGLHLFQAEIES